MAPEPTPSVRARLVKIRELEKEQGLAVAERALVEFIREEATNSPEAFIALARLLMKGRRFDDALRAAQKSRMLAPLEVEPLIIAGIVHFRMKDNFAAGEAFAKALQLDRNSARATLGAAAVKMAEESYDDALALCKRVLELDATLDRAAELIARIHVKKGDTEAALAALLGLIRKNPANKRALRAYVGLMKRENRMDEAVSFFQAESAANPEDNRRKRVLSAVAARAGNVDLAAAPYREKIEAGTASQVDRIRLAMTLIQAGQNDQAREAIAALGSQRVLKPVVAKLEGDIALKSGDAAAAVQSYEAACRAAKVAPLGEEAAKAAETVEALARLWKDHTVKSVLSAVKTRRAELAESRSA